MAIKRGTRGDDNLIGTNSDDIMYGLGGRDTFDGGDGNDLILVGKSTGSDLIDGGVDAGGGDIDQVVLGGDFDNYSISFDSLGQLIAERGNGVVETMTRVESVLFDDQAVWVVGGTSGLPSIQAAIDAASDGDIIVISAGNYDLSTPLQINKSLTFMGANAGVGGDDTRGAETVFSASTVQNLIELADTGITVSFDGIKFVGGAILDEGVPGLDLTFTNSVFDLDTTGLNPGPSIYVGYGAGYDFTFTNNHVESTGYSDGLLFLFEGGDLNVTGNSFTGKSPAGQNAVALNINKGAGTIAGNTFDTMDIGILLAGDTTGALSIDGNTFTHMTRNNPSSFGGGILMFQPSYDFPVTITNNVFEDSDYGIGSSSYGGGDVNGLPITIQGNTFDDNLFDLRANANGVLSAIGSTVDGEQINLIFAGPDANTLSGVSMMGTTNVDMIVGGGGNDTIDGGAGADRLYGGSGDDVITIDDADTVVDGGSGIDTAVIDGNFDGYSVAFTSTGLTVTDTDPSDGTDATYAVTNIEVLKFDDARVLVVGGANGFTTLQAAIDAANDGDTIIVAAGTYTEDLVINKAVTIRGAFAGVDGHDGSRASGNGETNIIGHAVVNSGAAATLDGLRFVETTTGSAAQNGLVWILSSDANLTNNVFYSTVQGGTNDNKAVLISPDVDATINITDNYITGDWSTITETQGSFRRGIYYNGGDGVALTVSGNTIENVSSSINADMAGTSTLDVSGNTFNNAFTGVAVGVELNGVTISNNIYSEVPNELNFRNFAAGTDATYVASDDAAAVSGTGNNGYYEIWGGASNDDITGTSFADRILANNRNTTTADTNTLRGEGGDDVLIGGIGADTFVGGTGNDQIVGNAGIDTVQYAGTVGNHYISFTANGIMVEDSSAADGDGAGGTDTISGVEKLSFANGNVLIVDGSGASGGFTTIQAAVDAAVDGDIILVRAGTYTEDVSITKGVTLLGAFAGKLGTDSTRTASSAANETNILGEFTVDSEAKVTISGFRFEGTLAQFTAGYGLVHLTSGNLDLRNSIFYNDFQGAGSEARAIYVSPGVNNTATITGNYITGAVAGLGYSGIGSFQRGVWYDGADGSVVTITNNTFEYTRAGVNGDLSGASSLNVSQNLFTSVATAMAIGYDVDGFVAALNSFVNTGEELNLRNITTPIAYTASDDIAAISTSNGTNPYNILGGTAADTITGSSFADWIEGSQLNPNGTDGDTFYGMAGDDFLFGMGGDDYLDGGVGADTMVGGAGNDTFVVDSASDVVTENANAGNDTVQTSLAVYTLAANVEVLNYTGVGAFAGTGNDGDNTITGGAGNDTLAGGLGADTLNGGLGADTLDGGDGTDTLNGGDGTDTLTGGAGNDTMIGGAGDDTYTVDAGDTVTELVGGGTDRVRGELSIDLTLARFANIENATLLGTGIFNLTGNAGANVLVGNAGRNVITGGLGADTLTGGAGNDRFTYTATADSGVGNGNYDRITDFTGTNPANGNPRDLIDLFAIDAKAHSLGNNAFTFIGTAAFTANGEGEIRYFVNNAGNTVVEINTDNTLAGAEMQIVLTGAVPLIDADFVL